MLKKIGSFFIVFASFLLISQTFNTTFAQSISLTEKKVIYNLPYPGLLPDHPLYFFKSMRDGWTEFITLDRIKKAELYLVNSDKKMAMALELLEKGKGQLVIETLEQAEKDFSRIPPLLQKAKKSKKGASDDLMQRLYQSNAKHQEVIQQAMKELPEGNVEKLNDVLDLNKKVYQELQNIK